MSAATHVPAGHPPGPVQDKELRIALVCFGGVSLAVYMHGMCLEVLELVRASRRVTDARYRPEGVPPGEQTSAYADLLRLIGATLDLRVVVDVLAGASAGGINATMLARALSHDLPLEPLRDLWLDNGDVTRLLAPTARAGRFSKWFLRPLLWVGRAFGPEYLRDREVRAKMSLFVRSRWFEPPFDGARMTGFMYDAVTSMGEPATADASLVPRRERLDLYVAVTDYYGYVEHVPIHDPPVIDEREHRHVLHFAYGHDERGRPVSDFTMDDAPALAFAARATSSFPGVFPPARLAEIDEYLAGRGLGWSTRGAFVEANFAAQRAAGIDPAQVAFIDGSVVDNRPFRDAILATRGRPAYRRIDRRVLFIDPNPAPPVTVASPPVPGFFASLRSAWSDIPRVRPVVNELEWVQEANEKTRRLSEIIEGARPQIADAVHRVTGDAPSRPFSAAELGRWRRQCAEAAERDAGFAYDGYLRLKLVSARASLAATITRLRGAEPRSPFARFVEAVVDAWCDMNEVARETPRASGALRPSRWLPFLIDFDSDFRERRLHFLVRGLNRLYPDHDAGPGALGAAAAIDALKADVYRCMDELRARDAGSAFSAATRDAVGRLFPAVPSAMEAGMLRREAVAFVAGHNASLDGLVRRIADELALNAGTLALDGLIARHLGAGWSDECAASVLTHYLGFAYWDVLTYPVMQGRAVGEFNEILVDRMSPADATLIRSLGWNYHALGVRMDHFAAFFSRAYRENDYLLGRLHALDRLIDVVVSAAGTAAPEPGIVRDLKLRGFVAILDAESKHLPHLTSMIAELRASITAAVAAHPV